MKLLNKSYIEIKKSNFYGYLYEINNIDEVKTIIENIKKENKGYRHIPYAYYFKNTAGKSDDKEPGNISISFLNNLERNNLNSHLVVVLRYYGGVKLGASNLSRVYGKCASDVIKDYLSNHNN